MNHLKKPYQSTTNSPPCHFYPNKERKGIEVALAVQNKRSIVNSLSRHKKIATRLRVLIGWDQNSSLIRQCSSTSARCIAIPAMPLLYLAT